MHLITGLYRQQLDSVLKSRCWLCFVREGFKDGACLIVSDCLVVKVRLSSQQEGTFSRTAKPVSSAEQYKYDHSSLTPALFSLTHL